MVRTQCWVPWGCENETLTLSLGNLQFDWEDNLYLSNILKLENGRPETIAQTKCLGGWGLGKITCNEDVRRIIWGI